MWNCGLIDPFAVALYQPSPDLSSLLATLKAQMDELYDPRGKDTAWSVNGKVWAVMNRHVADGPKPWAYYGVVKAVQGQGITVRWGSDGTEEDYTHNEVHATEETTWACVHDHHAELCKNETAPRKTRHGQINQ